MIVAEQELNGARQKIEAAAMGYINPESYGRLSPLPSRAKELD